MIPSSCSSPKIYFFAFSDEATNPTVDPRSAPKIGEPIKSPPIIPMAPPFAIEGTWFIINWLTPLERRPPFTSPVSGSAPNKTDCTFLEFATNPTAEPIAAPNNGPNATPLTNDTPAPIKAPAPMAPFLEPASVSISCVTLDIICLSFSSVLFFALKSDSLPAVLTAPSLIASSPFWKNPTIPPY